MKKIPHRSVWAFSLLAIGLLSGCATTGSNHSRYSNSTPEASSFVSQEMGNTIQSIERSLQVLVQLERGDEGLRKTNALGMTVAGAQTADRAPIAMPNTALAATPMGQARIQETREATREDLATRVRLTWTGGADELLRELSRRVGFSFTTSGSGTAPVIHIDHKDATVEQVLRDVASQVDAKADIRVDTATRRVTLAYKTP